jgi:poly(3-hydroxyalkanoate) synthetase
MTDKTKNPLLNENQDLRDDLLLRAETVQEMSTEISRLDKAVTELGRILDEKDNEIKELREDTFVQVMRYKTVQEMSMEIKALQIHHDEVVQAVKERHVERIDEKDTEIDVLRRNGAKVREALWKLLALAHTNADDFYKLDDENTTKRMKFGSVGDESEETP